MSDRDLELESILDYLRRTRGFDFTAYKRSTLKRRLETRMQMIGIPAYEAYLDHLEVHPDEFVPLFNTILINVTSFFRDAEVWEYLAAEIVPAIVAAKPAGAPIRLWTAGCASGEEAYTLAIVFAEALGTEVSKERVKIYATDVDEEALVQSRQAVYTPRQVESVPPGLLSKYFEPASGNFTVQKDLRRSVIFGRHDLIQDAPISRIDFLSCRNTLMYFNAETQSRIIARFHFALHDQGYLLLGKAEMLFNQNPSFVPVELKRRVFRANPQVPQRERLLVAGHGGRDDATAVDETAPSPTLELGRAAFETDGNPQLLLEASGTLLLANAQARAQFGITQRDLGRKLQELEISYRPADLRSCIDQALTDRTLVTLRNVQWPNGNAEPRVFDVVVTPLFDRVGAVLGTKIAFADVSRFRALQKELQRSRQELETAYEELQSTNEELETTNEELQSTVEELETTNEELQSTNEELETMNEELQSTNEELQAINDELRVRSGELNEVNAFMNAVLSSFSAAVVVIDGQLRVQSWNPRAADLWGVREEEVKGTHLLDLEIGLPVQELKATIKKSLAGEKAPQVLMLEATNRRGRRFACRVTCNPLSDKDAQPRGAILVMEEAILPAAVN